VTIPETVIAPRPYENRASSRDRSFLHEPGSRLHPLKGAVRHQIMCSKNEYGRITIDNDQLFQLFSKRLQASCDTPDSAVKSYPHDLCAK
jgi:hypothetical protein